MTKAQAKRLACALIAESIPSPVSVGPYLNNLRGKDLSEKDTERLLDALEELRKELKGRGTEPRK